MFDQDSGQVFREWTIARRRSISARDTLDWSRRRPYPLFRPRGSRGPRSLVDMATNVISNNIGEVSEEHLDGIPQKLLWRVWRFLEARGVCLHAWKLLSHYLLQEENDKNLGLYRFRNHICRPEEELIAYTRPLLSPSVQFLTHLSISGNCRFSANELLCLADIPNLGVLELIQPADELQATFPDVSDRLIRGWTEKQNPFPLLRILRIFRDDGITDKTLGLVAKFPSLVVYDVMGARQDWRERAEHAANEGWHEAEPLQGLDDSILRSLMLLAPAQEAPTNRLKELARNIDTDLLSLCSDSRCVLKFVPSGTAPPLLEYLMDPAKVKLQVWDPEAESREARACHGMAFEAWAFWLYSFIGQLSNDEDLRLSGVSCNVQAAAGPFVLPSKPMACLYLGHSGRGGISTKPSYITKGLFSTKRYTFTRPIPSTAKDESSKSQERPQKQSITRQHTTAAPVLKGNRKRRLDDILQTLAE